MLFYYIMDLFSTTCSTEILFRITSVEHISWQVENI